MAKGQVVRGTPVRHITNTGREGIAPGTPKDMDGTSKKLYSSNGEGVPQMGNGTPYNSQAGNPAESRNVRFQHRYGISPGAGGEDLNNPNANGNGVILDHMATDYEDPMRKPTLDSPVPGHAAKFDTSDVARENRAHLGKGSGPTAPNDAQSRDDLLKVGGVMSR